MFKSNLLTIIIFNFIKSIVNSSINGIIFIWVKISLPIILGDAIIKMGKLAVSQVLDNLIKKDEYENLLNEFNNYRTNESNFAYECDKLEASLQTKLYDNGNYVDIFSKENEKLISTD